MELRETFNSAASLYDDVRPNYPEDLFADIVTLSGVQEGGSILEVGCGTGKATLPFALRGFEILCLDIGADLVDVARRKLALNPNVTFLLCPFEEWEPCGSFDLVVSATAFHWVDANVRHVRAAQALTSGGALAVFAYKHVNTGEGFFREVQELYARYYVDERSDDPISPKPDPEPGLDAFSEPVQRVYDSQVEYTSEEYVKLLSTYAGHIALPEDNRRKLFEGAADLIDRSYGGSVVKEYRTYLTLRKKR